MPPSAIAGDKELMRLLNTLAKGPGAREVDQAANRSMRPMLDDARSRLKALRNYPSKYPSIFPKQAAVSGQHLDKDLVMRKQATSPGMRSYRMGAVRRARYLLHLLEYGTAPHFQPNLLGGWMHPGTSPSPTLTPAYSHNADDVVWAMQDELLDWVERTVRGHRGQFRRR